MPRISLVVPIYNVERYLEECLRSLAAQTFRDFEAILVDDGSTDSSGAIAERFAQQDERFKLIHQPNGGLSNARNNGAAAAGGEFLAFVDSDDVVPEEAYERLLRSLDETGSDFATGNVHRMTAVGTSQQPFLERAFARNRRATHITRFRALLADRIAPNKLWRRAFWDKHGFRFPEGRMFEDIPVVLPAHFSAKSVDVLAEPVYYYRVRATGDMSITQRRLEPRALRDRVTAVQEVSDFLGSRGPRKAKQWYDRSAVADDLRYFLDVLENADDDYRALFLEQANGFLDRAAGGVFEHLPAIERLKWHLVRERRMDDLLEVLRFQREDLDDAAPVRDGGRWHGDYPFRGDGSVPASVYALGPELVLTATVDDLRWDGSELVVGGFAYVDGIGAPERSSQIVTVAAVRRGWLRALRAKLPVGPIRFRTEPRERPELARQQRRPFQDVRWAGFEARLPARRLRRQGSWDLYLTVRSGGLKRRVQRYELDEATLPVRAWSITERGARVTAGPTWLDQISVHVRRQAAVLDSHARDGKRALLEGSLLGVGSAQLEAARRVGGASQRFELAREGERFTAAVPLKALRDRGKLRNPWDLFVVSGRKRLRVAIADDAEEPAWSVGESGELVLVPSSSGDVSATERPPRPLITSVRWSEAGELEIAGSWRALDPPGALWLQAVARFDRYPFTLEAAAEGEFRARLAPAHIPTLIGDLPLPVGVWSVLATPAGDAAEEAARPVSVSRGLYRSLPLRFDVDGKPFTFTLAGNNRATLLVGEALGDDERGVFNQRRLLDTVYRPGRAKALRDLVVFSSFNGRQYSDNPRAIHEELARRDSGLEHLWVIADQSARVPESARAVALGSREYHDALARARFVVTNDHLPPGFERRADQVVIQTWHGTPLKRLGFDVSDLRRTIRRKQHVWQRQVASWQYLVSPNRFSTPILRQAYGFDGEAIETGYPRSDVLSDAGRDARSAALRERLGIAPDKRVVLYAPTYRDHVVDRRNRYRLELQLDVDRLHDAVGDDTVLLFRKHHYIVDRPPPSAHGFVRDVSTYPDGTELLLAADVLITDYSSMMFDFANTGRPMLFFTYDLDAYRDEIRGFYFDFVERAPGPLLETTDAIAEALASLDSVRSRYAERYEAFRAEFCEFDDGHASARVVDRFF